MKKLRIIILLLFCIFIGLGSNSVSASSGVSIYINGERQSFSNQALIENGVTLVPLRGIFEELGAKVTWNQENKTIDALKGNTKISLNIGSSNAKVNGNTVKLSVPAQTKNGKTLVPLRFISESLGANVQWDQKNQKVTIAGDSNNEEIQNPKLSKIEKKEISILRLGETFSDEQVEVTIKEVEFVHGVNKGFKVYLSVTNKSTKPLEQPGGLRFKLNNSQYEEELNKSGYVHGFKSNGYIYPGETRNGYYQWLFDKDIKIKEIDFYIMESGILKESKATWKVELENEHKSENVKVENNIEHKSESEKVEDKTYPIQQGASLTEVENFLKQYYGSVTTPLGSLNLSYSLSHTLSPHEVYGVDIRYGDYVQSFLYTIDQYQSDSNETIYRIELNEEKLNETIFILKDFQKEIYSVMKYVYPNKNLKGGFYDSWYRYPTIMKELVTRSHYSWQNYRLNFDTVYDVGFYFTREWTLGDDIEWKESLK